MNIRTILSLGLSSLVLGGTMTGCTGEGGGIASASSKASPATAASKLAAAQANAAAKWLAKGDPRAIAPAEAAVAGDPNIAAYRVLLGQAYLKAGRFNSAHAAFTDALALSPDDAKAATNLALVQIAQGQWDDARRTLDTHARIIPASDRGLAMALAGDPQGGAALLTEATRSPDADAKTRQNLALALALSGRWREAKTVMAADMPADKVDARLMQWVAFAQPTSASDQVAALLGVVPVKDPGQPVALALVAPASVGVAATGKAVSQDKSLEAFMPGPSEAEQVAVAQAPAAPTPVAPAPRVAVAASDAPERPPIASAPAMIRASAYKTRLGAVSAAAPPAARQPAKGDWYVQIGAFDSAAVARDAWGRARGRFAAFAGHTPNGTAFQSKGGAVYRLSLGGFARRDADAMCRSYRAKGGACFVRAGAGDRMAQWVKPRAAVQYASR